MRSSGRFVSLVPRSLNDRAGRFVSLVPRSLNHRAGRFVSLVPRSLNDRAGAFRLARSSLAQRPGRAAGTECRGRRGGVSSRSFLARSTTGRGRPGRSAVDAAGRFVSLVPRSLNDRDAWLARRAGCGEPAVERGSASDRDETPRTRRRPRPAPCATPARARPTRQDVRARRSGRPHRGPTPMPRRPGAKASGSHGGDCRG